jgi:hypothetical protein
MAQTQSGGLSGGEIIRITSGYIGGASGYLGDFSYRTLDEFFVVNCELSHCPERVGTNRDHFINVLRSATPSEQSRILRALLERLPEPTAVPPTMHPSDVQALIARLDGLPVPAYEPANASQAVIRALDDAESLLRTQGAPSAVDRLHTALHGYLRNLCAAAGIPYGEMDTAQRLLKLLATQHPDLKDDEDVGQFVSGILGPLVTAVDRINDARNTKSGAHPNEDILQDAEATLVVNVVRTLLRYLDSRLG